MAPGSFFTEGCCTLVAECEGWRVWVAGGSDKGIVTLTGQKLVPIKTHQCGKLVYRAAGPWECEKQHLFAVRVRLTHHHF